MGCLRSLTTDGLAMAPDNLQTERIEWVDYAKGFCIIAVVTLYAAGQARGTLDSAGWMQYWVDFAKPFRMPDFFLLSGLFLARGINRSWRHYFDRKVVHFLYFYVLWSIIYMTYRIAIGEFAGENLIYITKSFVSMSLFWPFSQLWFILMLPIFFIATRLIKGAPVWLIFPILCLVHLFPPVDVQMSMMPNQFFERFVFFYAGYAFAPHFFSFARKVQEHPWGALVMLALWVVVNSLLVFNGFLEYTIVTLLLGFCGAYAVIAAGALLQKVTFLGWLQYLGANSIIIFLPFYLPMKLISLIMLSVHASPPPGLFAAVLTLLTILASVLLYQLTQKYNVGKWLLHRPAWSKIAP